MAVTQIGAGTSAVIVVDRQGSVICRSSKAEEIFGQTDLERHTVAKWIDKFGDTSVGQQNKEAGKPAVITLGEEAHSSGNSAAFEIELSSISCANNACSVLFLRDHAPCGNTRDNAGLLQQAILQTEDMVAITTVHGQILFVNPAFEKVTGYSAQEATGRTPSILKSGEHPTEFYSALWQTLNEGQVFRGVLINRRKDGQLFHEEKTITPIRNGAGEITHFVSTGRDVTARVMAQKQMTYLANYDSLTGLPNRNLFMDRLLQAIVRSQRDASFLALLYIDLDRFKAINDTLGYCAGDALLANVAARLRAEVRGQDTVARLGADEFAVILEEMKCPSDCKLVADAMLSAFQRPFDVGGRVLYVGISIGIACYPADGADVESMVKHADIAMFHAKSQGRSTWVNFSAVMEGGMLDDLSMETSLHGALANGEFEVFYQPIVDPTNGDPVAVEALLRWHSPQHGSVPPSRFIPLLEVTGMIVDVGRWVLKTACAQIKNASQFGSSEVVLAVNLSGRQFRDDHLVGDVSEILRLTGLPPERLELEITESVLIENSSVAVKTLDALKALKVRLAIDDFGTGYSSLSYLRRFPIDTLKIDRSFVIEMESSSDAVAIVKAIVNLAHSLGLDVVGEGVETVGQLALLSEIGCRKVQGYWFSPPVCLNQLVAAYPADKAVKVPA